ncbi:MAG: DNA-processing protein DprA [Armatimonadia bacterium]
MDLTDAWLTLNASGLSPLRQRKLLGAFGDAPEIISATDAELTQVDGITAVHVQMLRRAERELDLPDLRQRLVYYEVTLLPLTSPDYPKHLRDMTDPPPLLFVQGDITRRDELAVALVGTRKCSPYGAMVARRLAADLARRGFTIVSGMALGVDAEAHQGALEGNGRTIAVMASGSDITYPSSHRELRKQIARSGAVVTEYAFGTEPLRERFPDRNRLIAGFSLGTLVIEAPSKSGALITAGLAAEYGRQVLAVPGSIDSPMSHGCHELIKDGAQLVEVVEDVIAGLGIMPEAAPVERPRADVQVSGEEQAVIEALSFQPRHVDEVVTESGLPISKINSALMLLEMKGLVRRFPGNTYVRI